MKKLTISRAVALCVGLGLALLVMHVESSFTLKDVRSYIIEPNAQLVELEDIERDPTQLHLTFHGSVLAGVINITQRSPCYNASSPDCGKQAQDTTVLLDVTDGIVSLAALINNPSNESFGIATDGLVYGLVKPSGETYIYFNDLLRILRNIGGNVYDTSLYIPSEFFGKFKFNHLNSDGPHHFKGHAVGMTVPFIDINGAGTVNPYQQLATWAEIDTEQNSVTRLVGYRAFTAFPGLIPGKLYEPASSYFVQGSIVQGKETKGVFGGSANLSTLSGSVHITSGSLVGAAHEYRDHFGPDRAWMRNAMVVHYDESIGAHRRYLAMNLRLVAASCSS